MHQNIKDPTEFQKILERLGPGQTVVKDAVATLLANGTKASTSAMYQMIQGKSSRKELVEAFLAAAEAETERRIQVKERAARIAA